MNWGKSLQQITRKPQSAKPLSILNWKMKQLRIDTCLVTFDTGSLKYCNTKFVFVHIDVNPCECWFSVTAILLLVSVYQLQWISFRSSLPLFSFYFRWFWYFHHYRLLPHTPPVNVSNSNICLKPMLIMWLHWHMTLSPLNQLQWLSNEAIWHIFLMNICIT